MFDLLISSAHAQTAAAPQQSPFISFIPFVLIFLVMYFLMIRPQKKRMQEEQNFINKLAHGDEVYTKSGILGKVTGITEKVVTLELDGGAKMKVLKSHVGGSAASLLTEAKK
ncbi:preprotein translocase subunit YajC [Peredibacter starrii]|uniref:Sec translocon accessory complex subunit YajC n=1 Tax=Peredibacter starrii TaxID=28202 RepID=A0AAX4HL57_9BACT|nr:preprotein translocase subunit YajC [Peredibacter starrii]WPU63893.1 preprotein translocase subunit YajC [Peredibacter starrii]